MGSGERARRRWDRSAGSYDEQMGWAERRLLGDRRGWVGQARGLVLEVGMGTGLNLSRYAAGVRVVGVDVSAGMLARAREKARVSGVDAGLCVGDAMALPFGAGVFDAVVCTYTLCTVPDDRAVLVEVARVLRPGGVLLLVDHVAARSWWLRALQWVGDLVSVPVAGEHFGRRPVRHAAGAGLVVEVDGRSRGGAVEWVRAVKPVADS